VNDASGTILAEAPQASPKLGEELPVFCERCGYSLHGLPQIRCEHCAILQFHCPECGHHQPINTLRPAAQRILGRIRGGWLALVIFFKLNLFGWLLFAWVGMGVGWSYEDRGYSTNVNGAYTYHSEIHPRPLTWESTLAFLLFSLPFGMVLRMALLRWKRGWAVGLVLATMVMLAIMLGIQIRELDFRNQNVSSAYHSEFPWHMAIAFVSIVFGASIVWPLWVLLVHTFLPKRTANVLLNWQRSLSSEVSALAR
jgi:hypothetical protein